MKTFKANSKLVALGLGFALVAIWLAVFTTIFVLHPTLAQKTVIVTIAAASTEAIFYAGAVLFGISAFKNVRRKFRVWNSQ